MGLRFFARNCDSIVRGDTLRIVVPVLLLFARQTRAASSVSALLRSRNAISIGMYGRMSYGSHDRSRHKQVLGGNALRVVRVMIIAHQTRAAWRTVAFLETRRATCTFKTSVRQPNRHSFARTTTFFRLCAPVFIIRKARLEVKRAATGTFMLCDHVFDGKNQRRGRLSCVYVRGTKWSLHRHAGRNMHLYRARDRWQ